MVEYREKFLSEMKSLLSYFVKFSRSILPKIYHVICVVKRSDRRPIIMITYDESIFSINNDRRKVWTLNRYGILRSKRKEKGIMVSDFFLS